MKFVLAFYGTRGDVEPGVAVGRELLRRGHDVRMAVPPDLVGFVESAGLEAVAYGLETKIWLEAYRNFWTSLFGGFWRIQELRRLWGEIWEPISRCWEDDQRDADVAAGGGGGSGLHRPGFRASPPPTSRSITTFRSPRCTTCLCARTAS